MSIDKPLKLDGSEGNLKRFTSTEENYLAYQAGLNLASDSSDPGNLTLVSAGNTSIGSFVDTFFNQAVGTHPGSAITSGSTTTTLYQIAGIASEADSDFRKPVGYLDASPEGVYEMADSDLNLLVDRINSRIATSDYPGVFKLGSSSPGGDYTVFLPTVFSDTQTDGTTVNYNIYRRDTMAAPSTTKTVAVKRSSGKTGTFQGLQQMTANQVYVTFGQRAKTRRAVAGNIGSYQLRSSSQGAPTDPGTWRAVGTATDTKKNASDQNYTRTRGSAYTRNRSSAFTRVSTRTRTSNYVGNYVQEYTRTFAGNYSRNFAGNYVGNFIGNYTRDRASTYTRAFTRTSTRLFVGNYTRNFVGNYAGNFTRLFTGNYSRNFLRDFTGNYTQEYARAFTRNRSSSYNRSFTGNYTQEYARAFTRTRVTNFTQEYSGNFTGNYTRDRVTNFAGNYTRVFSGNYIGDFTRNSTVPGSTALDTSYNPSTAPAVGLATLRVFDGRNTYSTSLSGIDTIDTVTSSAGGVSRSVVVTFQFRDRNSEPDTDFLQIRPVGAGITITSMAKVNTGCTVNTFTGSIAAGSFRTLNVTGATSGDRGQISFAFVIPAGLTYLTVRYIDNPDDDANDSGFNIYFSNPTYAGEYNAVSTRNRVSSYTRNFAGNFVGNYTRLSTRVSVRNFAGNFVGNYSRNFTRNFTRNRIESYSRVFAGNYSRNFTRNFTRVSTVGYSRAFTRDRISTYTRNFSRTRNSNYTRDRISTYLGNFIQEYTRNFVGNYTRDRISTSTRDRNSAFTRNRSSAYTRVFAGDYTRDFAGNYTGNYSRVFAGNYSRNFVGNYAGLTIQSTSSTVQTYTLYVRSS